MRTTDGWIQSIAVLCYEEITRLIVTLLGFRRQGTKSREAARLTTAQYLVEGLTSLRKNKE